MSTSEIPEVLPIARPAVRGAPARMPQRPRSGFVANCLRFLWKCCSFVIGWTWRLLVGAVFCFNFVVLYFSVDGFRVYLARTPVTEEVTLFLCSLSFITSIIVVGWTYRWVQGLVARNWWKKSPLRRTHSFEQFCASLGRNAPTSRPRWFLQERIRQALFRPAPGRVAPGPIRIAFRLLIVPWHSLWRNLLLGIQALFCTYLLTGWGCLITLGAWEFGWLNSFHKGYEQAFLGVLFTMLLGIPLFIAAMFYVPMAQTHQAATGQARAFFEFRFVWSLIRARLTPYVLLAMLLVMASLTVNIVALTSLSEGYSGNSAASSAAGLIQMQDILFRCSLFLFPLWLLVHYVAAAIYRSAVLKVLRQGTATRRELHPTLAAWLDRLGLDVTPRAQTLGLGWYARFTGRFAYRRVLFTLLTFVWIGFVFQFYFTYFFRANPFVAFLNHPMIQLPCFDFIPPHLYMGKDE